MTDQEGYDAVSEKYRTYLIALLVNSNQHYTIWYTDLNTPDMQDKLLLTADGKVMTFPDIDRLKSYIRSAWHGLPDANNFKGWIDNYTLDVPYSSYDVDGLRRSLIMFETISGLPQEDALEQIDFYNLIGDYRDLVQDAYLEEMMYSPIMSTFFDSAYTFHFWKTPEGTKDPQIDADVFRETFNEIVDYFLKCVVLVR